MRKIFIYIPYKKSLFGKEICSYVSSSNEKGLPVTIQGLNKILNKFCKEEDKYVKRSKTTNAFDFYVNEELVCRVEEKEIDATQFPDVPNAKIKSK